jgi:hypothetical protein
VLSPADLFACAYVDIDAKQKSSSVSNFIFFIDTFLEGMEKDSMLSPCSVGFSSLNFS